MTAATRLFALLLLAAASAAQADGLAFTWGELANVSRADINAAMNAQVVNFDAPLTHFEFHDTFGDVINVGIDNLEWIRVSAVPEPTTWVLWGAGLAVFGARRRRTRRTRTRTLPTTMTTDSDQPRGERQ